MAEEIKAQSVAELPEDPIFEPAGEVGGFIKETEGPNLGAEPEEPPTEDIPIPPEPKPEETTVDEDDTVLEKTREPHSAADLELAFQLGIPAAEIDDMSKAELSRVVRHARRSLETGFLEGKKREETKEAPKGKKLATYDVDANPAGYAEEILDTIRAAQDAKALREEVAALKKEQEENRRSQQDQQAALVRQRIDGHLQTIDPDLAKQFDMRTAKGKEAYQELLSVMSISYQHEVAAGKILDEDVRIKRALGVMGVDAKGGEKKAEAKKQLDEKKEKWNGAALGSGATRGTGKGPLDLIREIKEKHRAKAPVKTVEQKTEWIEDD